MSDDTNKKECLVCKTTDSEAPLISIVYRNAPLWICPQHMPVLIHNPQQLIGTLPGAENLTPGEPD